MPKGKLVGEENGIRTWEYEGPDGPVQLRRYGPGSTIGHPGTVIEEDLELCEKVGQLTPIRDSERGKELSLIGQEKRVNAAWDALKETFQIRRRLPEGISYEDAYKFLVSAQIEIADSPEQGMAAVKAFPNVERALGIQNAQAKEVNALQINITVSEKAVEGYDERARVLDGMWEEIQK